MITFPAKVTAIDSDGLVEFVLQGGPRSGQKWPERAHPSYPAGTNLPPVVGDLIHVTFRDGSLDGRVPLAEPYHHGTLTPGTEIVIDANRNVVLREGTLGVARLTDDVDKSAGAELWNLQLQTLLGELKTQVQALGGTVTSNVPNLPTHIGDISSASSTVLAGD